MVIMQNTILRPSFYRLSVAVLLLSELFALGLFAYAGSFVRYMADDYCEINILGTGSTVAAVYRNYVNGEYRAANRFSNLLFVAASEAMGQNLAHLLPGGMLALWLCGLAWLVHEVQLLAKGRPDWLIGLAITGLFVFLSVWQAPNRFQTFYWRSSVATHFAPLVFFALLTSFILNRIRSAYAGKPSFGLLVLIGLLSFFTGGFSEPPTAVMLVVCGSSLMGVWKWGLAPMRNRALALGGAAFFGIFLALLALFFAPGNQLHGTMSVTALPATLVMSFRFALDFMLDTAISFPLPTFVSVMIPMLICYFMYEKRYQDEVQVSQIKVWLVMTPLLGCFLIAASFAPSAYGQYFPAERARFLGRALMTAVLLVEGGLFGVWLARWKVHPVGLFFLAMVLLVLGVYPLRAGMNLLSEIGIIQNWSAAWDERDASIRAAVADGTTELSVVQLDSIGDVIEYKGDPQHWVNLCAAQYYGLKSLVAP